MGREIEEYRIGIGFRGLVHQKPLSYLNPANEPESLQSAGIGGRESSKDDYQP